MGFIFGRGRELVKGQTSLMKVMRLCKVTKSDGSCILSLLEDIDKNNDGIIDIEEFFSFLQFDASEGESQKFFFVMEIFKKLETNENKLFLPLSSPTKENEKKVLKQQLSIQETMCEYEVFRRKHRRKLPKFRYVEFFSALYEFLTLDHKGLVRFTFDMIDVKGTGILTQQDLVDVVQSVLHIKDRKVQKRVQQLMLVLDSNRDGGIDFDEFYAVHIRLATLIFPVFRIQTHIRKHCISEYFWLRCTKQRQRIQNETTQRPMDMFNYIVRDIPLPLKPGVQIDESSRRKKQKSALDKFDDSDSDQDDKENPETNTESETLSPTPQKDQILPKFDAVGKEEAEEILDLAIQDQVEEQAKFDAAGKRLQQVLTGKKVSSKKKFLQSNTSDRSRNVLSSSAKSDDDTDNPKLLEGTWWIEHKPKAYSPTCIQKPLPLIDPCLAPNNCDEFTKAFVCTDTAGVLHAAEKSRMRALELNAGTERRQELLVKVEFKRGLKTKIIKRSSSCCCCYLPRRRSIKSHHKKLKLDITRPQDDEMSSETSEHKLRALSVLYVVPSHAIASSDGRRTTYNRQITGLPPPSVLKGDDTYQDDDDDDLAQQQIES